MTDIEKAEACPACGVSDNRWVYDIQACQKCGYGVAKLSQALATRAILFMTAHHGYTIVPRVPTEKMVEAALDDPAAAYCDRCMAQGFSRNSGWPEIGRASCRERV